MEVSGTFEKLVYVSLGCCFPILLELVFWPSDDSSILTFKVAAWASYIFFCNCLVFWPDVPQVLFYCFFCIGGRCPKTRPPRSWNLHGSRACLPVFELSLHGLLVSLTSIGLGRSSLALFDNLLKCFAVCAGIALQNRLS